MPVDTPVKESYTLSEVNEMLQKQAEKFNKVKEVFYTAHSAKVMFKIKVIKYHAEEGLSIEVF